MLPFFYLIFLIAESASALQLHSYGNTVINDTEYGLPYIPVHGKLRQFNPEFYGLKDDSTTLPRELLSSLAKDRCVYILKIEDVFYKKAFWTFFKTALGSFKTTLLLVLPKKEDILLGASKCNEAPETEIFDQKLKKCSGFNGKLHQTTLVHLENFIINNKPKCSIAITEYGPDVDTTFEKTIYRGALFGYDTRITTRVYDNDIADVLSTVNFVAKVGEPVEERKEVIITSYLDTYDNIQSYGATAGYNSGLIALLELANIFKENPQDKFNITLVLTSGNIFEYFGYKYYLNTHRKTPNVEVVINLDDISDQQIYLHALKDNKHQFTEALSSYFALVESYGGMDYPHEVFVKSNVPSFTLSASKAQEPLLLRTNSFNTRLDHKVVAKNIVDIATRLYKELLGKRIKLDVRAIESSVGMWESRLSEPRCSVSTDLMSLGSVNSVLDHLKSECYEVKIQNFRTSVTTSKLYKFLPSQCDVYITKHASLDVLLLFASFIYIFLVWIVMRGSLSIALNDLKDFLNYISANEDSKKIKKK